MRLIDADAVIEFWRADFTEEEISKLHIPLNVAIENLRDAPIIDAVEVVRCENCEHFDLDHFENFKGFPLIVAHEICNRWGNGCKTDMHGFCFLGDRKANE